MFVNVFSIHMYTHSVGEILRSAQNDNNARNGDNAQNGSPPGAVDCTVSDGSSRPSSFANIWALIADLPR